MLRKLRVNERGEFQEWEGRQDRSRHGRNFQAELEGGRILKTDGILHGDEGNFEDTCEEEETLLLLQLATKDRKAGQKVVKCFVGLELRHELHSLAEDNSIHHFDLAVSNHQNFFMPQLSANLHICWQNCEHEWDH